MSLDGDARTERSSKAGEERLEHLDAEVRSLRARVERLESLLAEGAPARPIGTEAPIERVGEPEAARSSGWGRMTVALSRVATACFVLVLALVLRTITDNGLIGLGAGSVVGMAYAAALVVLGAVLYEYERPAAPVLSVSGVFLLSAVVLETHARFGVLSAVGGYVILVSAGLATAAVSAWRRVRAPVAAGVLALTVAGPLLGFPDPDYPVLGGVLWVANGLALLGLRRTETRWPRWVALVGTVLFWGAWAFDLGADARAAAELGRELSSTAFQIALVAFALFYWVSTFLELARGPSDVPRPFDVLVPGFTACWGYASAYAVLAPVREVVPLGAGGILGAALLFGLMGLRGRGKGAAPFAFAGSALLLLALPTAVGSAPALPVFAWGALGLAILSKPWGNGAVRVVSYLLAIGAGVFSWLSGALATGLPAPWARAALGGLFAGGALLHYRWCRRHGPPPSSGFFSGLDRSDESAVALLLVALAGAFLTLRLPLFSVLEGMGADLPNVFPCAESMIVSLSALVLLVIAYLRRNTEVRGVAILVMIVAALKTFGSDLFATRGIPLVLDVLCFGLVALVGSVILGRWQKSTRKLGSEAAT